MKQSVAAFLALVMVSFALTAQSVGYSQGHKENPSYADDKILVKMKAGAELVADASAVAEEILPARGARSEALSVRSEVLSAGRNDDLFLVQLDGRISVEEAIRQASADPRVEYAEPDYFLDPAATTPNDTFFNQQWGLFNDGVNGKPGADIGATRAWDLTQGAEDVVVAVIDTGTDLSHSDLAPNAWVNPREIAGNNADDDGNGFTDDINGWNFASNTPQYFVDPVSDRHGTHVSGILGAAGNNGIGVTGVAWRVKVMSLKFIYRRADGRDRGETSDAIKAIEYAIDQRRRGVNVRVINASWGGGGESRALRKAIAEAGEAGILFVTAAGNGGSNIDEDPSYPPSWSAEIPSVISVASLDRSDSLATFSNFGLRGVSVGAPGVQVLSTVPGGYAFLNGTSQATPFVSGIAVLIWTREPTLAPSQVRQRIISTAEPVLALASKAVNPGRANAFNASTNSIPGPGSPAIASITTNKKSVTIDGLGFLNGSSVIEVNGFALSDIKYPSDYLLANGTVTRLTAKVGKSVMNIRFPRGVPVTVTIFNPTTGERSPSVSYTRI